MVCREMGSRAQVEEKHAPEIAGHQKFRRPQRLEVRCNITWESERPHATSLYQVNTITTKKKIPKRPVGNFQPTRE